ncbi:unnamed protein product [Rotaria sp. Silwood1]|nr:unnamed protein product [Rotaria sp. Silwood1]
MDYQLRSPRGKLVLNVYRQRENQSSTNVAQTKSGLIIDNETELSSEIIKEQLNSVADIITQAIIEVPTKHLLHLKELAPSDLRVLARSDDNDAYSTYYVDTKQIDLAISLNKTYYFEELEACLCECGLYYLGYSIDILALSANQLNAIQ